MTVGVRRMRLDRRELAGALADLGVFVPIAVALVLVNGLSATAVLAPAALLYVVAGLYYRVPVPVQPLKAFGAIAVAQGLPPDVIAAGAILMGLVFVPLGATGLLDRAARWVPVPIVRGIQLSVGLLFGQLAWTMVTRPPATSPDARVEPVLLVGLGLLVAVVAFLGRRRGVALWLLLLALGVLAWRFPGPLEWGPSEVVVGVPSAQAFAVAAVVLVLPQLPLTFANSCVATADAARGYFGAAAGRVTAGRLAVSLGVTNLLVGLVGGMPVCHGAGGLTAHRSFGARTGAGTALLGVVLLGVALVLGRSAAELLAGFPLAILAGLLAVAGLLHVLLLRDLRGAREWGFAVGVGLVGFFGNLAIALAVGLLLWWGSDAVGRRGRPDRLEPRRPGATASGQR